MLIGASRPDADAATDLGEVTDAAADAAADAGADAGVEVVAAGKGTRLSSDHRVRALAVAAAVLLVLPVFLHVNGWHVGLGQSNRVGLRSPGVTVPLNMLAIAALVAVSAFWSGGLISAHADGAYDLAVLFQFAGDLRAEFSRCAAAGLCGAGGKASFYIDRFE